MRVSTFLCVATLATVTPAAADSSPMRLTLEQLTARSLASSRAQMAHRDTDMARARVDEANAARLPKLQALAFLAPSPEIDCVDAACTRTDPEDFAIRIQGAFGGASLQVTQPLFTFGKIATARAAARDGVRAQSALEDELAGDLAVEAARAYWGLKLARELVAMLEDGIAEVGEARARLEERLKKGGSGATIQDRQRIDTLLAEAKIQLSDARAAEATALAGVRAIAGRDDADVDEDELAAVELELPDQAATIARARSERPQVKAAAAGARAADALVDHEASGYWPDLAVVGTLGVTRAQGVDDAPSAVYAEPYHQTSAGVGLVLRWNAEPWTTHAKVERARAAADKADELRDLAETGATLDARTAWAEAAQAREKVTAAGDGETAARGWLAAVLQADAIGTAETRDLADAYIAWFQMRARLASAIFQWNVATVRVARATGEFTARQGRRKEHP